MRWHRGWGRGKEKRKKIKVGSSNDVFERLGRKSEDKDFLTKKGDFGSVDRISVGRGNGLVMAIRKRETVELSGDRRREFGKTVNGCDGRWSWGMSFWRKGRVSGRYSGGKG